MIDLKQALSDGKVVCGCASMSCDPKIIEMLGHTGFDFVFIDTEHAPIGSDQNLEHLIRAAEVSGIFPIVRVKENSGHYIRNALEAGAKGIVIPQVSTKEDAQKAAQNARFPLTGIRGADPTVRSAKYMCGDFNWEAFIQRSNEEIMVIPLLENKAFVPNIEDILSVDGIDAVSFGPTDFALSLGLNLLYDFNHPKIVEAFEAVLDCAKRKDIPVLAAVNPPTVEQSNTLKEMGVTFLLYGSDIGIIAGAFNRLMTEVVSKVKL